MSLLRLHIGLMTICALSLSAVAQEGDPEVEPLKPAASLEAATEGVEGSGPDLLVDFKTNMGTINCRLFHLKAPLTVRHFVGLATGNVEFLQPGTTRRVQRPFYDGLSFHRVIPDFLIQGGCPLGTGKGGPGFRIKSERKRSLSHRAAGTLSLSNAGRDQGGSQFFITLRKALWLDERFTAFGECHNLDIVRAIADAPILPPNRPRRKVVMEQVLVRWGTW